MQGALNGKTNLFCYICLPDNWSVWWDYNISNIQHIKYSYKIAVNSAV